MEVSRTPVREAFIKLSNEALVTVVPQKGSFVSKISLSRVKEERFLRESLETSVIEVLILNHDAITLDRLHSNLEGQKRALDEGNTVEFIELDDQFHAALFDLADRTHVLRCNHELFQPLQTGPFFSQCLSAAYPPPTINTTGNWCR